MAADSIPVLSLASSPGALSGFGPLPQALVRLSVVGLSGFHNSSYTYWAGIALPASVGILPDCLWRPATCSRASQL